MMARVHWSSVTELFCAVPSYCFDDRSHNQSEIV